MSEHAFQIVLVIVGGIIGLASSVVAGWFASHHAKTRHRQDRLARIHNFMGIRCAIRGSDPREEAELWSEWLQTSSVQRLDTIEFMIGFAETNTMQMKEALQKQSIYRADLDQALRKSSELQQQLDMVAAERGGLQSQKDALDEEKCSLEERKSVLETEKDELEHSANSPGSQLP